MRMKNFCFLILLTAMLFSGTACVNLGSLLQDGTRGKDLALETLTPAKSPWTRDKVLLLPLEGTLDSGANTSGLFGHTSALVRTKEILDRAEKDPSIHTVLLRINSPGGTVTASDLLYQELLKFKKKTGKKIVVMSMDMTASGGYYAAMAGDVIYAHPTSIVGSIGVIAFFPNIHRLGEKLGVDLRVVKTGAHKDIGSFWRDLTPEDQQILQGVIDSMQQRFLSVVRAGRPHMTSETLQTISDGRIFTAAQAKELGMVDEIGYLDDAFAASKRIAGMHDAALVTYTAPYGYKGNYYATAAEVHPEAQQTAPQTGTEINLFRMDGSGLFGAQNSAMAPFYYLWTAN
jgi:protease IV